jgi:ribosomal protein S18 acetylase RimI-like enzyme
LTALIGQLEELAADAWPAAIVEHLDGWRLRYTSGVTRRANSVWPNASDGGVPLSEKLAAVEAFYDRWGLPARYQICPAAQPRELDAVLTERGYSLDAITCVQTATVASMWARADGNEGGAVRIADRLEEPWFAAHCDAEQVSERDGAVRRGILQRIAGRQAYALLSCDREPAALGLGVLEGGWLGVFCMATLPVFRRRGMATAVLRRLAEWGKEQGATAAYLQVMEENAAACALYARLGFKTLYQYYYREAPG